MTNLADNLTQTAEQHGDRPAVKLDDLVLTYAELQDGARRVAALLKSTRGSGAVTGSGLVLPNVPPFPVLFYGALAAGAVVVPMNPLLKGREVKYYLEDSGASIVFAWKDMAEEAGKGAPAVGIECIEVGPDFAEVLAQHEPDDEVVDREDDDTVVLLYTSGTTGQPKGAELTHHNMLTNAATSAETLVELTEEDVVMGCLPLFHVFGLTCGLNASVLKGSCLTLIPRFDAEQGARGRRPRRGHRLRGRPDDVRRDAQRRGRRRRRHVQPAHVHLRRVRDAGRGDEEVRGEVRLHRARGLRPLRDLPVASFNQPGQERKPGSIGTIVRGVEMKVVDDDGKDVEQGEVGEIAIKGENVMQGYWGREEDDEEAIHDGWFLSGDMAKQDEDGYFFIVDRKKDLIIRGGYNVYPREVEEALYEHESVAEVAVIGIPDDSLGEEVGAAVALKSGEKVSEEDLQAFAKERLAAYKYPRAVWIVDELPKGPTGKILRREVSAPEKDDQ